MTPLAVRTILTLVTTVSVMSVSAADGANAENSGPALPNVCSGLPGHVALESALSGARAQANGGFNLDMWGTVVNRDGEV
jgi:hypothetical protein